LPKAPSGAPLSFFEVVRMEDIDTVLMLLENPNRREILRRLTVESHYPLQLAKELKLSTQAVMKHLDVLERHGLVRCQQTPSTMGPSRKCYFAVKRLSIRLDIAPNLFETRMWEQPIRILDTQPAPDQIQNAEELVTLRASLRELNRRISMIDRELADLIRIKEEQLGRANQIIKELFRDYEEREVLHYILTHDHFTLSEISKSLGLREESIRNVLERLLRMNLVSKEEL